MKSNALLDSIQGKIMDQNAVSLIDIMKMKGLTREKTAEIRDLNLSTGAWEVVHKQQSGRSVKAYRLKKSK
jgi:hypothetical protein